MKNNLLKGEHVFLRAIEPEDLEKLYTWENDPEFWTVSETLSPISKFILKKYINNAHKDIYEVKQLRLMISLCRNNHAIGTIDLYDFDPYHKRAATGILIADKNERDRGYAKEALELLKEYSFRVLKLNQLYCHISEDNETSVELFLRAGFEKTAKKKKWNWNGEKFLDQYLLQCFNP